MNKGIYIKDMEENTEISGTYIISSSRLQLTKSGKPFWNITLSDSSGNIEAKIWHPQCLEYDSMDAGRLVYLSGTTNRFNDNLQVKVEKLEMLEASEVDRSLLKDFIPVGPYDPDEMLKELRLLCLEEFQHPAWRKLVLSVLNDKEIVEKLSDFPAAKKMHQAYLGGLLEHTLGVFKICRQIATIYTELDRQTLLAGALFHDIGKLAELSGGLANDYTDDGRLIGHISLGIEILVPYLKKSGLEEPLKRHLLHLILSHHGEYEFGAPKLPQTAEAFVLHYADNMDAKLAQCRSALVDKKAGEWSDFQKSFSRSILFSARTPDKISRKPVQEEECLSLLKE